MRVCLRASIVLLAAALAGCYAPSASRCGAGYCGEGQVCLEDGALCGWPEESCRDGHVGETCRLAAGAPGVCVDGACATPRCGDGLVREPEACDDGAGNSDVAPDACRTSCV